MKRAVLFAALAAVLLGFVCVASTEVILFYEEGCPYCAHVEALLRDIQDSGTAVTVTRYEVASPEGRDLLARLVTAYGAQMGSVPYVFVSNVALVRDTFYGLQATPVTLSERTGDATLRQIVERAAAENAPSPLTRLPAVATEAVFVTTKDCPDCDRLDAFLVALEARHPELAVRRISVDDEQGKGTFEKLERLLRVHGTPPGLFVGETALVGGMIYPPHGKARPFTYTDADKAFLTEQVEQAIAQKASSPLQKLHVREKLTLWAVIGAAALDSINPCDFAVMLLLLGRLLVIGRRRKVIWAGLAWSAGVYIVYFMMGYVFYTILGVTVGTRSLRGPYILAVSSIAILMGLWQMKDLLWYGKWLSIEVPESWQPTLKRVTNSVVSLPGVFIAGMLDALFLAPCTSGPYIAILSLLSQTTSRLQGAVLLLLYNLIFILPMIGIALAVHFGLTTTARAERWRTARMGTLHFVTGVVMFALGVGMIIGLQLGYI